MECLLYYNRVRCLNSIADWQSALQKITKGAAIMKNRLILMIATLAALCLGLAMPAAADDKNSNIGLKLNLGLGSQDVSITKPGKGRCGVVESRLRRFAAGDDLVGRRY
jgi:hypothetical protein